MKGALWLTAAAGLVGSAFADGFHRRHDALHHRRGGGGLQPDLEKAPAPSPQPSSCGCTTRVITRPGTPVPVQPTEKTTTIQSTSYTTRTVSVYPSQSKPVDKLPTPVVTVYPTPGTYTVPATTIVVTSETTVCAATSTSVEPGTHTYGGVTTVVETATTVTCPVPTVSPSGSTSTSVLTTTTYVCPSGGTYTVAPTTSTVDKPTVIVYPTPATYTPGTYSQPENTVTVVESDYEYVCPPPTAPAPTSSSKPALKPSTPPAPAPPAYSPPPKPAPSSTKKPAPEPSSTDKPEAPGGGKRYGITYTPYDADGGCKDADTVKDDISKVKLGGFENVRVYAPDCNALENVGSACVAHGIKMIVGVFAKDGAEGAKKQVQEIADWANWDIVDLVVVGNEAVFKGTFDAATLADLITFAKETLSGAGYGGLVTTAEPLNIWQENADTLCPVCDVAGGQFHPFFNGEVTYKHAGEFVAEQITQLQELCGKDVLNLETGWPSKGEKNGEAVPGEDNQAEAIMSILKHAGDKSVILSFDDDPWKEPGEFGVEPFFGCMTSLLKGALNSLLGAL